LLYETSMRIALPLRLNLFLTMLTLGSLLSFGAPAALGQESKSKKVDDAQIQKLILQLADEDSAKRAEALKGLVATGDPRLPAFLASYRIDSIYLWKSQLVLCEEFEEDDDLNQMAPLSDPLSRKPLLKDGKQIKVSADDLEEIGPSRRERKKVRNAILQLELWSIDLATQLSAVKKCGDLRQVEALIELEKIAKTATVDPAVQKVAGVSILLIRLGTEIEDQTSKDRIKIAQKLGEMATPRALALLEKKVEELNEIADSGEAVDDKERSAYQDAIGAINDYQVIVDRISYVFQGVSLGSILVLMALGLAITFGVMKVINMAHGEMLMIGAVTAWASYEYIGTMGGAWQNWYYVIALPLSFITAATAGLLIEVLVVRKLYKRPLDSLLATIGISFILIQAVRIWKGDNLGMSSPIWFTGGLEVIQGVIFPYNRLFIIGLTTFCVLATAALFRFTTMGLKVRATVQNREMAEALGVNTRIVDMFTFAYGAGLAGVAGYAIVLLSNPTPEMGKEYIVKSFLVVVVGGVGKLAGVIVSGLALGFSEKIIEPIELAFMPIKMFDATWAQVAVLMLVVLFIQRRPSGLFPDKGRLANQANNDDMPFLVSRKVRWRREFLAGGLAIFLGLVFIPLMYVTGMISPIMVNKLGMFVAFAIVAIGLDLIWGYMGVLSLCQFLFFSLGGYCMGLYLANHGPVDEYGIPTCLSYVMSDVSNKQPPWFLSFFESFPSALFLGLLIPGGVALLIGLTTFVSRVRGVYFAILTQVITVAIWLVFMKNDLKMGGTNGLTNFTHVLGFSIADHNLPVREDFDSYGAFVSEYASISLQQTRFWLYITSVVVLIIVFCLTKFLIHSGFGRVLVAIRDDETRLRFSGYKTWVYKTAAFAIAGVLAGIGGMLYVPQKGIITPHQIAPFASILVVAWVALGGRGNLWGAVIGAISVNLLYDWITSYWPVGWMFVLGGLFVLVPLALPGGVMSLPQVIKSLINRTRRAQNEFGATDTEATP
jgi:urea ABC transporter permease protein UrtB